MVKTTNESKKIIKDTFSQYDKADSLPKVITEKIVIHLYPERDTIDEEGQTCGFWDSLFFMCRIYFTEQKKYIEFHTKDAINIDRRTDIRIFKDGSTMITVYASENSPISIDNCQMIYIENVNKS